MSDFQKMDNFDFRYYKICQFGIYRYDIDDDCVWHRFETIARLQQKIFYFVCKTHDGIAEL